MKNMKIGARLALGFGVVVVLMMIVVATGLNALSGMDDAIETIVDDNNVKIEAVATLRDTQQQFAIAVRDLTMISDEKGMDEADARMAEAAKLYAGAMAVLRERVNTPEGKVLLDEVAAGESAAMPAFQVVRQYGRNNDLDAAVEQLTGVVVPKVAAWQASIGKLLAYQADHNRKSQAAAKASYTRVHRILLGLGLLSLLAAGAIAWMTSRSITRPLNKAVEIARTVAAGDLTSTIVVTSNDETGQLLQSLSTMNDSLQTIVASVRSSTDTIATASNEIASGNLDLSSRTEQQAGALEETASSMEELTTTVKQNADNARQANQLAASASATALQGGEVVSRVVETMTSIDESAKKIVDIIAVIDGIAFQTNILALNAAVEAARAGEQGRGFAVVASEVRNLAHRSASAAKEIKVLISDSVQKVEAGSQLVGEAGTTMERVVQSVRQVSDIMAEISSASSEQEQGIEQITQAVSEMDRVTQQNAALVEEAAAAAQSLLEQSQGLVETVSVFKVPRQASGFQAGAGSQAARPSLGHAMPAPVALSLS
ncbi:methyl-accepting chemotaxis protein [Massilia consociata]|uniref:Methyl-accepting chemotaxis protein n=1 Tax=Massilia consociata TaxID=760117 RepID=A0ABV6FKD5_9BURK